MTDSSRTFTGDFKRFFVRGLVVVLPTVLTLWIVVKAYQFVDNSVAQPINHGIRLAMFKASFVSEPLAEKFRPTPEAIRTELFRDIEAGRIDNASGITSREILRGMLAAADELPTLSPPLDPAEMAVVERLRRERPRLHASLLEAHAETKVELRQNNIRDWWIAHWYMELIGLLVAVIMVYFAGRLLGGYLGRRTYRRIEDLITQLPIFKQVYPSVKQVVDFLFGDDEPIKFNRVVACEYPRRGIWSVGFLTGETLRTIGTKAGDDAVTIFIPSSPTPFTGYTITVTRADIIDLPLTVDEAIRFAVSGGVLVPKHQRITPEADPDADGAAPRQIEITPVTGPGDGPSDRAETAANDAADERRSDADGTVRRRA